MAVPKEMTPELHAKAVEYMREAVEWVDDGRMTLPALLSVVRAAVFPMKPDADDMAWATREIERIKNSVE